jgi:hypothetical protein
VLSAHSDAYDPTIKSAFWQRQASPRESALQRVADRRLSLVGSRFFLIVLILHLAERFIPAVTDSQGFLFRAKTDIGSFDLPLFLVEM